MADVIIDKFERSVTEKTRVEFTWDGASRNVNSDLFAMVCGESGIFNIADAEARLYSKSDEQMTDVLTVEHGCSYVLVITKTSSL